MKDKILLWILVKCARKLFRYCDLYMPNETTVEGIVFTNDEKYMDYCLKYEVK